MVFRSTHLNEKGMGIMIPVLILLVLTMLALNVNRMTVTELKHTYRSTDNYTAMLLAEAAIAEAEAEIRHKANNEFRDVFLTGSDGTEFTLEQSKLQDIDDILKDLRYVPVPEGKGHPSEIDDVEVTAYIGEKKSIGNDTLSKVFIEANITFNNISKHLKVAYDVKIVDCSPPAKDYCLFVNSNNSDSFNKGDHLWVNDGMKDSSGEGDSSLRSKGVVIGSPAIINTHTEYSYNDYSGSNAWGVPNDPKKTSGTPSPPYNFDMHYTEVNASKKDSTAFNGTEKSLITDNSSNFGVDSSDNSNTGNHPWHKSNMSQDTYDNFYGGSQGNRGKHFISKAWNSGSEGEWHVCSDTTPKIDFSEVPNPFFFSGSGDSHTHLFGWYCRCPTKIYGDVKKKLKKWTYEFEDKPHTHSALCDTSSAAYTTYTSATDTMDKNDIVKLNNSPTEEEFEYKTSESELEASKPCDLDENINNKSDFKQSATRYLKTLHWNDTTFRAGSGYFMIEGLLYCDKADAYDIDKPFGAPCMLVINDSFTISQDYKVTFTRRCNYSGNNFFKWPAFFSHIQLKGDLNAHDKKIAGGLLVKEQAALKGKVELTGNLAIEKLQNKEFGGNVMYSKDTHDVYKEADFDARVITISPIPCLWADLQNK